MLFVWWIRRFISGVQAVGTWRYRWHEFLMQGSCSAATTGTNSCQYDICDDTDNQHDADDDEEVAPIDAYTTPLVCLARIICRSWGFIGSGFGCRLGGGVFRGLATSVMIS